MQVRNISQRLLESARVKKTVLSAIMIPARNADLTGCMRRRRMIELKPCPFCGGKPEYTDDYYGNGTNYHNIIAKEARED
jgi:hypothetical protein